MNARHAADSTLPPEITAAELLARHDALFLDAYGVLVDGAGALPGAAAFVHALNARAASYFILTNDASRLPATLTERFARLGLPIPAERIISSGSLIAPWFAANALAGARCVVLGTPDSHAYVTAAGGRVVAPRADEPVDVVVVCDESGYPFLETLETVLSMLCRALDAGSTPRLLLPNPDLIYPKHAGAFGLAAGSIALVLESALALRYSAARAPRFDRLGKPYAPIYAAACERAGTRDAVMVGDQLATDVQGAHDFGVASALAGTGLTSLEAVRNSPVRPTYLLPSLAL